MANLASHEFAFVALEALIELAGIEAPQELFGAALLEVIAVIGA